MANPTKVMIVDDHDMVRLGLKTYLQLESDMEVVLEASNGKEALDLLTARAESGGELPDLILMDLMMPEMDGIAATRAITERFPDCKIVILTSFLEDDKVMEGIEAGAVSYVLKSVSSEELVFALRGAVRGMPIMNSEVSQALARGIRQKSARTEEDGLTAREKEVLMLIAEGKSNKEISDELFISIKTVKTHVSNLLMKLGAEDRTQLAIYAHRKGLIGKE
jgi:NarL family two-component system response regulator LiaR